MSIKKRFVGVRNFRLTLTDEDNNGNLWSGKFSRMSGIVAIITATVVAFGVSFAVLAFTPLRTLIPGYPDARTKQDAIENAIRIDSLQTIITRWELYSENLRRVVEGQAPLKVDSILAARAAKETQLSATQMAKNDSLLKDKVMGDSKFDIKENDHRVLPIEGMHFFAPLKGVVSQGYDKALHPYLDITAPGNSVVMAVLDGTIISAGWSDEDGYTVRIQHEGDIISVYKHNEKLMKKTGEKVTAGTPIAIIGNTGSTSDGDHLHFELWHKGEAVDPTQYINF